MQKRMWARAGEAVLAGWRHVMPRLGPKDSKGSVKAQDESFRSVDDWVTRLTHPLLLLPSLLLLLRLLLLLVYSPKS